MREREREREREKERGAEALAEVVDVPLRIPENQSERDFRSCQAANVFDR